MKLLWRKPPLPIGPGWWNWLHHILRHGWYHQNQNDPFLFSCYHSTLCSYPHVWAKLHKIGLNWTHALMYKRVIKTFSKERPLSMWGCRLVSGKVPVIVIISADPTEGSPILSTRQQRRWKSVRFSAKSGTWYLRNLFAQSLSDAYTGERTNLYITWI
jgi:hypothetical protein